MKKKIFAIAMMALATAGTSTVFAARADEKNDKCRKACARTECTAKTAKDSCCAKHPSPFDGLNLTAEQQTKIKALKNDCKAAKEAKKAESEKIISEMKSRKEDSRREYLAKIKEILTPEQYVQFLENAFTEKNSRPDIRKGRGNHREFHLHKGEARACGERK
jgi:Spy/CpxP family protein refolding chaperone